MPIGFLNLLMLLGLGAVIIPPLIHLLNRRRYDVVDWGAMQFLQISETTRRVTSDLQNYFDSGTHILLDRLRTSPSAERTFRQSQVDAAVKFCGQLFGSDYASLLAKAADIAGAGHVTNQISVAKAKRRAKP